MEVPKTYDFGSGEVVELSYLETIFNISRPLALRYLKALRISPMYFGTQVFFSLPTFKKIMYVLSRPGSPGFIFPGSSAKVNKNLRKSGNCLVKVTDEILEQAASPTIMAEMVASDGHDTSMIKKLVTHSNTVSRKKKNFSDE